MVSRRSVPLLNENFLKFSTGVTDSSDRVASM